MLEGSNVQAVLQITDLIRIQRAYEMVSQMMTSTADLSSSTIQTRTPATHEAALAHVVNARLCRLCAGWKSNSTEGGGGYNELVFDDTKGSELVRSHAQYNMDTTIENDETRLIKNDRTTTIKDNDTLDVTNEIMIKAGQKVTGWYSAAILVVVAAVAATRRGRPRWSAGCAPNRAGSGNRRGRRDTGSARRRGPRANPRPSSPATRPW